MDDFRSVVFWGYLKGDFTSLLLSFKTLPQRYKYTALETTLSYWTSLVCSHNSELTRWQNYGLQCLLSSHPGISPKKTFNLADVWDCVHVLAKQSLYLPIFSREVLFLLLILLLWRHVPSDKERSSKCSTRDLADIQAHQADEENWPLPCTQASEEVPSSHSPVRKTASLDRHHNFT